MLGGNIAASVEVKDGFTKNEIGEKVVEWVESAELFGWLDYQGGQNGWTTADAKVQETTHVFICDYEPLEFTSENARMVIDDDVYEILMIDDPMNLREHIEIYLKYVGGGQGVS